MIKFFYDWWPVWAGIVVGWFGGYYLGLFIVSLAV